MKENCNLDTKLSTKRITSLRGISHLVESKLAAKILFSSDVLAPSFPDTLVILENKHPSPADGLSFSKPPDSDIHTFTVTGREVFSAGCFFRSGFAGGLDGLRLQHLKDFS
ncbi:hypothetical protein PYW08_014373 [Mythimna loreyi]|uniref:Uncharacterized protein n=1 Tax=Mythimna loreyi TaxID=667449 RepID=A0ACC2R9T2_9NEOP|nr:hypothetical protein PYW08_014373 [Mythimna loreyi]